MPAKSGAREGRGFSFHAAIVKAKCSIWKDVKDVKWIAEKRPAI